ncbi:MAG: transcription antitermination factor NusB [Gammaproteobacteria bacterium]
MAHTRHTRRWSRRLAMQALYQWQLTGQDPDTIETQFREEHELHKADIAYFTELLHGVPSLLAEIDQALAAHTDRGIEEVDPVERALLRSACYELLRRPDVPPNVIINEAVELAKKFGSEQGHKFINGVLDKAAGALRDAPRPSGI